MGDADLPASMEPVMSPGGPPWPVDGVGGQHLGQGRCADWRIFIAAAGGLHYAGGHVLRTGADPRLSTGASLPATSTAPSLAELSTG